MDIETGSSQTVKRGDTQLAVFKVKGKYYASQQMCPHRRAFALSDGLIGEMGRDGPGVQGQQALRLVSGAQAEFPAQWGH